MPDITANTSWAVQVSPGPQESLLHFTEEETGALTTTVGAFSKHSETILTARFQLYKLSVCRPETGVWKRIHSCFQI